MGTFNATFTLTAGSSASVGGFNIVGNPGSVSIATGVTRASLATGVTYNNIADTVTEFTITSTGDCTNSVTVQTAPEPTPTPTSTVYTYDCFQGSCIQVVGDGGAYGTLQLCQGDCSSGGDTYNCTPQGCTAAVDGDYLTLQECLDAPCVQGPQE
jgi:hypothetical protein